MLTLYLDYLDKSLKEDVIYDVEREFETFALCGSVEEGIFISKIEKGKYNPEDNLSFIDRFGFKLHKKQMSTGCKAALCVLRNPNKIVDLSECGLNARDMILSFCRDGAVFIKNYGITFVDYANSSVNIKLDNYIFTSISRLNYYVFNERPFYPDFSREGITCLI